MAVKPVASFQFLLDGGEYDVMSQKISYNISEFLQYLSVFMRPFERTSEEDPPLSSPTICTLINA